MILNRIVRTMASVAGTVSLTVCLASPNASGLELVWSDGTHHLATPTSRTRVTLLLRTTRVGESLPAAWTLVWTGRAAVGCGPAFHETTDPSTAGLCTITGPANVADSIAHAITATFCQPTTPATAAAYAIDLDPSFVGALKVVLSPATAESPDLQATVGSDRAVEWPLSTSGLVGARTGEKCIIVVRGADLATTASVSFLPASGGSPQPLEILAASDTVVAGTGAFNSGSGTLALTSSAGLQGALSADIDALPSIAQALSPRDWYSARIDTLLATDPASNRPEPIRAMFDPVSQEPWVAYVGPGPNQYLRVARRNTANRWSIESTSIPIGPLTLSNGLDAYAPLPIAVSSAGKLRVIENDAYLAFNDGQAWPFESFGTGGPTGGGNLGLVPSGPNADRPWVVYPGEAGLAFKYRPDGDFSHTETWLGMRLYG